MMCQRSTLWSKIVTAHSIRLSVRETLWVLLVDWFSAQVSRQGNSDLAEEVYDLADVVL